MKLRIAFFILLAGLSASAQKSDREALLAAKKIKCESILAAFSGKPESIDLLITEGKEGLKLAGETDYEYLFAFHTAIATGYYYKQDFKSAKQQFELSYLAAKNGKMLEKSLKPLGALTAVNHYLELRKDADEAAEKLKNAVVSVSDARIKADAFYNLGVYNQQQKYYYGLALDYFLKSVDLYRPIADTTKIVKLRADYGARLMVVAEIYLYLKQPEKALQYLNETKPVLGLSLITDIAIYGKFVRAYALLKNDKEALKYYNLLHQTAAGSNGNWSELVSSNVVMAELALGRADYRLAKMYLDKADAQAKKDNKEIMISSVNIAYGDYYKRLKDYKKATVFYKLSEHGAALYNQEQYLEVLKALTTLEILAGNQTDAAAYHDKYISLSDTLTHRKISLNLAETEARFQNKEKQLRIDNQNVELSYGKKQRVWLMIGIALVSLVAVLLVINYRNKKRTADLLSQKNKKLVELNDELEEANQTKAKLFGIIGHDLRSPISQIYQFLKLQQLNPKLLNENQKTELSNKIQNATGSLLETMEELLLWSKSQMNQFKTDIQPVNLQMVLDQVLELLKLNIDAKNITVVNEVKPGLTVQADPYYLQTIVRNLVQNAIKASPDGGEINIQCKDTEQGAMLSITNAGAEFTTRQYDQVLSNSDNGLSGLGLKLVDELSRKSLIDVAFENPAPGLTRVDLTFKENLTK